MTASLTGKVAFINGGSRGIGAAVARGLARDLGGRGITVNNVLPGPTDTDMNPAGTDFAGALHDLMARPRHGTPDEVASMIAYLASAEAGLVTGADLSVDGGFAA